MAPGRDEASANDDAERERLSKKLDGYEAMGLDVDDLRHLLEEDIEGFKSTYMGVIRAQLEGGEPEPVEDDETESEEVLVEPEEGEGPSEEEEPSGEEGVSEEEEPNGEEVPEEVTEEEPSEEVIQEEADEEMELQLEGAGPEEALATVDIPEEDDEGEVPEDEGPPTEGEEVKISVDEDEEEGPAEEVPTEPEEEAPEEEAEIQVGEASEEEPEEEPKDEMPDEPAGEDEALIVVAEVIDGPEGPVEEVPDVHLDGLKAEERLVGVDTPEEPEPEEPGPEEVPEQAEHVPAYVMPPPERPQEPARRPVKKVVQKEAVSKKTVPKEGVPKRKAQAPPKKPEGAVRPPKEPAPDKEPSKKPPAKKKKAPPPPPPKRRGISRTVIAIAIVAMLVIASGASYFLFFQNEDPVALFTFDPGAPLVGEEVTFDARNAYDPDGTLEKYVWDFGDGTSGTGRVVMHSYIEEKAFRVRLSVEDDKGARATTQRTVTVEALQISMGEPLLGDLYQYSVEGHVELSNTVDGLFKFKSRTGSWEYIYSVEADVEGEKNFEVTGTRTAKDGFLKDHENARVELTVYDLTDIRGVMETSLALNPNFAGSVNARLEEDVCQHWERGIRSTVEMDTDFSAVAAGQDWADVETYDDGTFYSQLTGIDETFSLSAFLRETTFSSEDTESHELAVGDSLYIWKVRGMERVEGRESPSLHVNVTMDRDTLQANNLDSFFIDVWLEPGLSQVAKHHVYVKGREEGNRFTVDMTETLGSESKGSDAASGLPCRADHTYTHKGEYADDFDQLDAVPEKGGETGGFRFSPEEAYGEALLDAQFSDYMSDHPDAFFHLGNYTEGGGQGTWVMLFGERGSSDHFEVEASGTSPLDIDTRYDNDIVDDKLPQGSPSDIGEVVTLSRGLRLMRAEPEIRGLCFDGNDPDWSKYTFNVTEGVSTISLDPTSVLVGSQETGYVYMLVSRSGPVEHRAALDGTNGQVLFTWKHSMTWDYFDPT